MKKKCVLFHNFKKYLDAKKMKSKLPVLKSKANDCLYVNKWQQGKLAVLFKFTDGMVQVSFNDGSILFLSPDRSSFIIREDNQSEKSFDLQHLQGASFDIIKRV